MKNEKVNESRRNALASMLALPAGMLLGCGAEAGQPGDGLGLGLASTETGTVSQALTAQQRMDSFYAMNNVIRIDITMDPAKWIALRDAQPVGGTCNFDETRDRYEWFHATSVSVSGSSFPAAQTFSDVGIKKKSFCGSFSTTLPCLKLDFAKFTNNKTSIENLIGSQYLTLNNSVQDPSFIRQPLGYAIYKQAGLPYSRCNFAIVTVNGAQLGKIYVNVEPIRERYIERVFGGLGGNLYELERDDFTASRIPFIDVENLSPVSNKKDLTLACQYLASSGILGMMTVFDINNFLGIYAMEYLLKHNDGYTTNLNNTYVYNSSPAVAEPGGGNVHMNLLPWGIDQILKPDQSFRLTNTSILGGLIQGNSAFYTALVDQVRTYRQTVFDRNTQDTVFKPLIDLMEYLLILAGVPNATAEVAKVRKQLKLVRSAAYQLAGLPSTSAVNILDFGTVDTLHASNTESLPTGVTNPTNFEVVHSVAANATDRWLFQGSRIVNEQYSRWLHASQTFKGTGNRFLLYTTAVDDASGAKDFTLEAVPASRTDERTGQYKVRSNRTGQYLRYATDDPTPGSGRQRVDQGSFAEATNVFLY